jgi:hypothetical protein
MAAAVVGVAAAPALWANLRINGPAPDPRQIVVPTLSRTGLVAALDRYTDYTRARGSIFHLKRLQELDNANLLVTSNLAYSRFYSYAALKNPRASRVRRYYDSLQSLPRLEISNGRPTLAYFNPVLLVIAIDGHADRLDALAYRIREAAPTLRVILRPGRPEDKSPSNTR